MEEHGLIFTKTRYVLSAKPAEDADRHRDEPVLSPPEPAKNRPNPKSYEVPYDMANQEFTRCLNDLAQAMREFSETYNAGNVIHVRDVMNLRDASHRLGNSVWFDSTVQNKRSAYLQLPTERHEHFQDIG
jgi:hypothetical protein